MSSNGFVPALLRNASLINHMLVSHIPREAEKFLACRLLLVSLGKPPFIARLSRDGVEKLEDKKRDGIHEVEHPCRCQLTGLTVLDERSWVHISWMGKTLAMVPIRTVKLTLLRSTRPLGCSCTKGSESGPLPQGHAPAKRSSRCQQVHHHRGQTASV